MVAIWVRSFRLKYKKEEREVWGLKETGKEVVGERDWIFLLC